MTMRRGLPAAFLAAGLAIGSAGCNGDTGDQPPPDEAEIGDPAEDMPDPGIDEEGVTS